MSALAYNSTWWKPTPILMFAILVLLAWAGARPATSAEWPIDASSYDRTRH